MLKVIFDNLLAELMPPTTFYIWAQSGKLTSQKNAEIRPRFFTFNSSATLFLDILTHPHTIQLTKFGMVCDNIIILMELVCKRLNSLDYNPDLSTFHHSSSLGLGLFAETLWIEREWSLHLACGEKTVPPYIWYNLWMLLRLCQGFPAYKSLDQTQHGIKLTTVQIEYSTCVWGRDTASW